MTGVGTLDIASLSSLLARVAAVEESHAREKLPNECAESNGEESGCGTLWEQQVGNGNNKGNNSYTLSSTPLSSLPLRTLLPSPSLQTAPTDMQPLPLCTARPREMSGYLSGGFAHITPTTSPVSYQGGLSSSVLSGVGTQSGSVSHIGVSGCGGASAFSTLASGSASSATSSSQAHVVIPQTLLSGTGDDDGVGERSGNNFCPLLENRHWNAVHSTDASSRDVGVTHGAAAATSLTFSSSGRKTAPRDRCNVAGQPSSTASCVHVNGVALSESVVTVGGGKAAVTMHRHAQPQEPVQTQNQPVTEANIYLQGLLRESHPPTSNAAHGTGTNSFTSLNKSVGSVSMWNTCGHAMELTQSEHSKLNTHCSHRLADPMLHKVRVGANNVTIPCAEGSRHIVVGGGGNRDGVPVVATAALDVQRPQLCPSVAVFLPNNGGDLHQQHTPAAAATSNNTIINSSSIPNNSGSFHSLTLSNAHLPGNVENVGVVYQPCAPQQLLLTNSSVVKMVNDQAGCRDLQFVLEHFPFHSVQVQGIIAELLPVLPHVMMNQYGNFLVQKLLEIAPDAERLNMLEDYLSSSLCEIAVSPHGNYAVQKLIDSLRSQHETKLCAMHCAAKRGFS
ncbi:putative Pumilio family RNA binding repeat [Trypanosoma vivax]|nr:putative Pumilio family RNA binding repeat [Trypanosoma vivax]